MRWVAYKVGLEIRELIRWFKTTELDWCMVFVVVLFLPISILGWCGIIISIVDKL